VQNAFIESFNWMYRTNVLNAFVFESLDQASKINAEWLLRYNEARFHDALASRPATYQTKLTSGSCPLPMLL
jgi:putative transposase